MLKVEYVGGTVKVNGKKAGTFDAAKGIVLDDKNKKIGKIEKDYILDGSNHKIGNIDSGYIRDANHKKVGKVISGGVDVNEKILIKGGETLSDVAKVAIVHFLVKHIQTF